jgi:hypothetical protein
MVGMQAQSPKAEVHPLRIGRPHRLLNAERLEEVPACEVRRALARRCPDDPRQEVDARAAVSETRAGRQLHGQTERKLHPMLAPQHREKLRLRRRKSAIQPGSHSEQVLDCHSPLGGIQVRHSPAGEEIEHGLHNAADVALIDSDAN